MADRDHYFQVEAPDNRAELDFLSTPECAGFVVNVESAGGMVHIVVRQPADGICQQWIEHTLSFPVVAPTVFESDDEDEDNADADLGAWDWDDEDEDENKTEPI